MFNEQGSEDRFNLKPLKSHSYKPSRCRDKQDYSQIHSDWKHKTSVHSEQSCLCREQQYDAHNAVTKIKLHALILQTTAFNQFFIQQSNFRFTFTNIGQG